MGAFYFTDYSVQSLTLAMLSFVISIYLISLKNKDISNWMLLFFFFFFGVFSVRGAVQNSTLTFGVLPATEIGMVFLFTSLFFMTPFALYFHKKMEKTARRTVLIVSTVTLLFVILCFVYMAILKPWTIYQFSSDQFFFKNVGRIVGIPSSIFVILPAVIFFVKAVQFSERDEARAWKKIVFPRGRFSRACVNFAWMMLLQIAIASLGIVAYLGIVPFSVIKILMLVFTLVLFFFISILYFNTAPQMSTFMVKIVGISLLTIMVFCSGLGSFLIQNERDRYDQTNLDNVEVVETMIQKARKGSIPLEQAIENVSELVSGNIMYIAERDNDNGFFSENYRVIYKKAANVTSEHLGMSDRLLRDEEFKLRLPQYLKDKNDDEEEAKRMCLEDIQRAEIPLLTRRGRLWDYEDPSTFYHFYNFSAGNRMFEVGFNYLDYRKSLSFFSSKLLISQVALSLVIIVLFPLFFSRVITNPLGKLLLGVKRVNKGDLQVQVPANINDEIGFIAKSFNRMVGSIAKAQSELMNYSKNLELMVDERTEKLQRTMTELEASNAALVRARDEIWGEMQLAKKIQTHLVPANPTMDDYEISVHMAPADDVGGDYYDVLKYEDREWIIIGDVSGHGVSAGLVMMMAKTAIQVALENLPHIKPAGLLDAVNASITENIQRFGEEKYMTISAFSCQQRGEFLFAGLHQDILIYRSETGEVETVETEGMWLGVLESLEGLVNNNSLNLQINDTMLLLTDGLIEAKAKRTNSSSDRGDEIYGQNKLVSLLSRSGKESTEIIKKRILESLSPFETADDVTFVVIKRKK